MDDALLTLLTAPFTWVLIGLAVILGTVDHLPANRPTPHTHVFRRHPSGEWHCDTCPTTRNRHGGIH